MEAESDKKADFNIHLLDVGPEEYGDCVLCKFGSTSILIDGAHTGNYREKDGHTAIQDQVAKLLGSAPDGASKVDLLVVSHAHEDHIGCLPRLVDEGSITARYALVVDPGFGWGRTAGDAGGPRPPIDARVSRVIAALREEPRTAPMNDAELDTWMADAESLETRYKAMLQRLADDGTRVIRFGRDPHQALVHYLATKGIALEVIGPRQDELLVAADLLLSGSDAATQVVRDLMAADAAISAPEIYRRYFARVDALDASRIGQYVNLQSIVFVLEYAGKKCLFAGDMQLADPQTGNAQLIKAVSRIRKAISASAPYAFAKLCHHGSWNGLSQAVLSDMQTPKVLGICAGEGSTHHPDAGVLKLLQKHKTELKWVRTDHNGQSTVDLSGTSASIRTSGGKLNDPQPNSQDVPTGEEEVATRPSTTVVTRKTSSASSGAGTVDIVARIPHRRTRVTITVDVAPEEDENATDEPPISTTSRTTPALDGFVIGGGGRALPPLVYVTDSAALSRRIGEPAAKAILGALMKAPGVVVDNDFSAARASQVAAEVARVVNGRSDLRGVVLVGGYNVVPSKRIDCLPKELQQRVNRDTDPDDYIVWSDDIYGDIDQDQFPELPVSRVPDGGSAQLLRAALSASGVVQRRVRAGVRNVMRPFADHVFSGLPGVGDMRQSIPVVWNHGQAEYRPDLTGDTVYIMLHGSWHDGTTFDGENPNTGEYPRALHLSSVPDNCPAVVFTGCCWGALAVDRPANLVAPDAAVRDRTPDESIALRFLANGAQAFLGCTGVHYSPGEPKGNYFGAPMHSSFWKHFSAGASPAEALLRAKEEYARDLPHGQKGASSVAWEYKILRQYACLGLGW